MQLGQSTRALRFQFVEFLPQERDLLGLFEENCQQGGLEGQQRFGLPDGSDVPARGGEETIEDVLVASAQGAAEGRQQTLGLVEMLGDGDNGAAHEDKLKQRELCNLRGGHFQSKNLFCFFADLFNKKGALFHKWRRKRDDHRRGQSQTVNLSEAGFQEAVGFVRGDVVIVEGVQQVENQEGLAQGGSVRQQGSHFVAGEGAADEESIRGGGHVHRFSSKQVRDAVREEAIPAVQHSDCAAQGEFGGEGRALVARGVRSAENDQAAGLKNGQEFHAARITPARRNKQPPPG